MIFYAGAIVRSTNRWGENATYFATELSPHHLFKPAYSIFDMRLRGEAFYSEQVAKIGQKSGERPFLNIEIKATLTNVGVPESYNVQKDKLSYWVRALATFRCFRF